MTDKEEMDPTKMLAQGLLGYLIAGMENQELRVTIKELEDRQKEVEGMELDLELDGSDLRLFYKPQESK